MSLLGNPDSLTHWLNSQFQPTNGFSQEPAELVTIGKVSFLEEIGEAETEPLVQGRRGKIPVLDKMIKKKRALVFEVK